MNKDPNANDSSNNPEETKDSTTYSPETEDEAYKTALEWLPKFKETVAVYTGRLFIPNSVFRLMAKNPDLFSSVRNDQERHDALVSVSITSEEKAEMRQLRQNIYGECEHFLTKLYKPQHTDKHTSGDADMPTMVNAKNLSAGGEATQYAKERHKKGNPLSANDFKIGANEKISAIAKKHNVALDSLRRLVSNSEFYLKSKQGRPPKD